MPFFCLSAQKVCEPGSTSKQDCNTCKCSVDGTRLACTRRFCLPHEITPKHKRETVKEDEEQTVPNGNQVCVPNEIKMEVSLSESKIFSNQLIDSISGL
jgi:hypothetical protein